jgi:hypothetical protein
LFSQLYFVDILETTREFVATTATLTRVVRQI